MLYREPFGAVIVVDAAIPDRCTAARSSAVAAASNDTQRPFSSYSQSRALLAPNAAMARVCALDVVGRRPDDCACVMTMTLVFCAFKLKKFGSPLRSNS
jgi:hypothetical protein